MNELDGISKLEADIIKTTQLLETQQELKKNFIRNEKLSKRNYELSIDVLKLRNTLLDVMEDLDNLMENVEGIKEDANKHSTVEKEMVKGWLERTSKLANETRKNIEEVLESYEN